MNSIKRAVLLFIQKHERLQRILLWKNNSFVKIVGKNNYTGSPFRYKNCHIEIKGNNNTLDISTAAMLKQCKIVINGDNNHLKIMSGSIIEDSIFLLADHNNAVSIGMNCYVIKCLFSINEETKIVIGESCLMGRADIRTSDNHSIIDQASNLRINKSSDVQIGNQVWISNGAVIMKGVKIDCGSIVGAASVVTKDVPSNVIVAGVPAKVVRENIRWIHERI
jgi:acetyltransferase-like isoleucine patch superfamily enzyme